MAASTPRRSLRPAVALLALSLLIGWSEPAAGGRLHRVLSPPLEDEQTAEAVQAVSQQAQLEQDDPSVRLLPHAPAHQDHMEICCLHANILDIFLESVLPHYRADGEHVRRLRADLKRIGRDLEAHGCDITRYHDHHHTVDFRKRLTKEDQHRVTKALGEVDILFSYLQDHCVAPSVTVETA